MKWKTWIFDCDGVLLDSNTVKREAMYRSALRYGPENAEILIDYHVNNGGIGRGVKFRWFLQNIIELDDGMEEALRELKQEYAKNLWTSVLACNEAPEIRSILSRLKQSGVLTYVVSGAEQEELRTILLKRNLTDFDAIYGSPDTKDSIFSREISNGNIIIPAIFLGDSRYDYEAAQRAGFDFAFLYEWTDFKDWRSYFQNKPHVFIAKNISQFVTTSCGSRLLSS